MEYFVRQPKERKAPEISRGKFVEHVSIPAPPPQSDSLLFSWLTVVKL